MLTSICISNCVKSSASFSRKYETCTRLQFNFISFLRKIRNKYTLVYCTMPFKSSRKYIMTRNRLTVFHQWVNHHHVTTGEVQFLHQGRVSVVCSHGVEHGSKHLVPLLASLDEDVQELFGLHLARAGLHHHDISLILGSKNPSLHHRINKILHVDFILQVLPVLPQHSLIHVWWLYVFFPLYGDSVTRFSTCLFLPIWFYTAKSTRANQVSF